MRIVVGPRGVGWHQAFTILFLLCSERQAMRPSDKDLFASTPVAGSVAVPGTPHTTASRPGTPAIWDVPAPARPFIWNGSNVLVKVCGPVCLPRDVRLL